MNLLKIFYAPLVPSCRATSDVSPGPNRRSNTTANIQILQTILNYSCYVNTNSSSTPVYYSNDALTAVARIMSGVATRYSTLVAALYTQYYLKVYPQSSLSVPSVPSMTIANTLTRTGHNGDDAPRTFAALGSVGSFATCDVQAIRWWVKTFCTSDSFKTILMILLSLRSTLFFLHFSTW